MTDGEKESRFWRIAYPRSSRAIAESSRLKRVLTIFLALAILVSFLIPSLPQTANEPVTKQDNGSTQRELRGTDEKPLSVKVIPSTKTQEEADKEQKERNEKSLMDNIKLTLDKWMAEYARRSAEYNRFIVWITGGLLGVAVVQLCMFGWQLWLTRSTTQAQLRAYVLVEDARFAIAQSSVTGVFVIKNFGVTPASAVTSIFAFGFAPSFEEALAHAEKNKEVDLKGFIPNVGVLGPGATYHGGDEYPVTLAQHTLIATGQSKMFIWGEVKYATVFGQAATTKFRMRAVYERGQWLSQPCEEGNQAT